MVILRDAPIAAATALVRRHEAQEIYRGVLRCDPPREHHAERARHAQKVAVPRRHRRIACQRAVRPVVAYELLDLGD